MEMFFSAEGLIALATLVVLEVVLGIDNLIFIAILSEKLPPEQRQKARLVGLGLALIMRLGLLTAISWLVTLTEPLITVFGHAFSGRDLILLGGGLFLLFKATTELHECLEAEPHVASGAREYASFGLVIAQIVVLDAVFSLDAIVTAVGMTKHLPIMMAAVVIAMSLMVLASRPLTNFVNAHPTVVVLCLSFLLLIGLSLIVDGFGFHLPKGYLYAAIVFSIIIEFFNQISRHNTHKHEKLKPRRVRTAEAVMRLMGTPTAIATASSGSPDEKTQAVEQAIGQESAIFVTEEVNMVSRVLSLSERTVRSVMTHRSDAEVLNIKLPVEEQRAFLLEDHPSVLPVCKGSLDNVVGVAHSSALLRDIVVHGAVQEKNLEEPHIVPESMRALKLLDVLRRSNSHLVFVADEFGSIEGLITYMDLFEAIAGDMGDDDETPAVVELSPTSWRVEGTADVHLLEHGLGLQDIVSESNDYTSLAGFMLAKLGKLPEAGDAFEYKGFRYTAEEVSERRITSIFVEVFEEVHQSKF